MLTHPLPCHVAASKAKVVLQSYAHKEPPVKYTQSDLLLLYDSSSSDDSSSSSNCDGSVSANRLAIVCSIIRGIESSSTVLKYC
jgi:hypothetical protein